MKSFFANLIPFCLVAAIGTLVFQELFNRDEPVNGGQKQASAITAMPSQLSFDEQHELAQKLVEHAENDRLRARLVQTIQGIKPEELEQGLSITWQQADQTQQPPNVTITCTFTTVAKHLKPHLIVNACQRYFASVLPE